MVLLTLLSLSLTLPLIGSSCLWTQWLKSYNSCIYSLDLPAYHLTFSYSFLSLLWTSWISLSALRTRGKNRETLELNEATATQRNNKIWKQIIITTTRRTPVEIKKSWKRFWSSLKMRFFFSSWKANRRSFSFKHCCSRISFFSTHQKSLFLINLIVS